MTFGEYAEVWRGQQVHHRQSTSEQVSGVLRRHVLPAFGHLWLGEVTRRDVQEAVVLWSLTMSPATLEMTYGFVASIFKHAVEDRLVQFTPCVKISLPAKSRAKVVPLTVEQVHVITRRVPAWYRSMVTVCAATGLRSGELRGVTVDRVVDKALRVDRQLSRIEAGIRLIDRLVPTRSRPHGVRTAVTPTNGSDLRERSDKGTPDRRAATSLSRARPRTARGDCRLRSASL